MRQPTLPLPTLYGYDLPDFSYISFFSCFFHISTPMHNVGGFTKVVVPLTPGWNSVVFLNPEAFLSRNLYSDSVPRSILDGRISRVFTGTGTEFFIARFTPLESSKVIHQYFRKMFSINILDQLPGNSSARRASSRVKAAWPSRRTEGFFHF